MLKIPAKSFEYSILKRNQDIHGLIFPYFRDSCDQQKMWLISPQHGRSYVMKFLCGRWIISKGNGLSYTDKPYLRSQEQIDDVWGILLYQDAIRDFKLGNEISELGIKTNKMEAVIELNKEIGISNDDIIRPVLLQYSVECPYRISDAPFMPQRLIEFYVSGWERLNKYKCRDRYKIAAYTLISNLRILHDNQILHNALSSQNLTWALEQVDFELTHSPKNPYNNDDYRRHIPDLFEREILHTYQIILDIAWILRETPDYNYIDLLFRDYGFEI